MNFYCREKGRGPSQHSQNITNSHSVAIHLTFKIHHGDRNNTKGFKVFGGVVAVAFQSAFRSEMHQKKIIFLKTFLISSYQNDPKKKLSKNNQFF
jgi:hypothetical protein